MLRGADDECWVYLPPTTADKVAYWELDGPARQAFKRLKLRLGLESVSGLSQHALLVDVAAKALSRCVRALLLLSHNLASLIQDWASMMGRSLIRHVQGRLQP